MKRIKELDGLRFFAIFAVFLVHYRPPHHPSWDLLATGWVGVDLFFVISGFLITTILLSLRDSSRPFTIFYWRRALRILPPYFVVLLCLCVAGILTHDPLPLPQAAAAMVFLSSLGMAHHAYVVFLHVLHSSSLSTAHAPLDHIHFFSSYRDGVGVFWSLSVEELFYLVWAPVVLRCSRRMILIISALAVVICPVLRLLVHDSLYAECFLFVCRFDTLMIGSLLALLFATSSRGTMSRSTLSSGLNATLVISLVASILLCVHCGVLRHIEIRSTLSFAAFGYTLLGTFFACVVGICCLHTGSEIFWARILRSRPLVYIGTVSYGMYLIHIPVWVALYRTFSRLDPTWTTPGVWMGLVSATFNNLDCGHVMEILREAILAIQRCRLCSSPSVSETRNRFANGIVIPLKTAGLTR